MKKMSRPLYYRDIALQLVLDVDTAVNIYDGATNIEMSIEYVRI